MKKGTKFNYQVGKDKWRSAGKKISADERNDVGGGLDFNRGYRLNSVNFKLSRISG